MCDIISLYQKNKGVLSMNILSQILNYETKNLFIDDILEKIKAKLTNAILSILTNFSKNRYIKSFLNLQKEVNNLIIELIIDFISLIDNCYKKSDARKKEYYINKSNVPRTIYTIYGEITFERTLYRNKNNTKKYYCFVDQILGIEAYNLYDPVVRDYQLMMQLTITLIMLVIILL